MSIGGMDLETDTVAIMEITQLIARERESRDMGFWNRMRDCFHHDSVVHISWFQGSGHEFVESSKAMTESGMLARHRLGPVVVEQNGNKAVASLSAIIDLPTELDGKAFTLRAHTLLLYTVKARDGEWRISSFEVIYRQDEFIPAVVGQTAELPEEVLNTFRASYRNLAYSLHLKNYQVDMTLAGEDRPESVQAIYQRLYDWVGLPVPN